MEEQTHRTARLIAVIAATIVSLACGTNVRSVVMCDILDISLTDLSTPTQHGDRNSPYG